MSHEPPVPTPHAHPDIHLDAQTLADLDAAVLDDTRAAAATAHLQDCADCRARLDALGDVRDVLRRSGEVGSLPDDVAARLEQALTEAATPAGAPATATVVPGGPRRRTAWNTRVLQAAAVTVLVLAAVGIGYSAVVGSGDDRSATGASAGQRQADSSGGGSGYRVTESGRAYTKESLGAAVPGLIRGRQPLKAASQAAPQDASGGFSAEAGNNARLAGGAALAACVANLAGGPVTPLAVDIATFDGKPATVIVLPTPKDPTMVDAFVVEPGCPRGTWLYFERVPRP